jgi:hypothetical protein
MFSPFLKSPVPRSQMTMKPWPFATVVSILASTALLNLVSSAVAQDKPSSTRVDLSNQAEYSYESVPQPGYSDSPIEYRGKTARIDESFDRLIDPLGRVVGCAGETLPSYAGFTVAFYDADPTDPTGASIGRLPQ